MRWIDSYAHMYTHIDMNTMQCMHTHTSMLVCAVVFLGGEGGGNINNILITVNAQTSYINYFLDKKKEKILTQSWLD